MKKSFIGKEYWEERTAIAKGFKIPHFHKEKYNTNCMNDHQRYRQTGREKDKETGREAEKERHTDNTL